MPPLSLNSYTLTDFKICLLELLYHKDCIITRQSWLFSLYIVINNKQNNMKLENITIVFHSITYYHPFFCYTTLWVLDNFGVCFCHGFVEALELFDSKMQSLSGPGDFQLAALVMLTLSSSPVRSFHSICLICCSSSSWSLIHWPSLLCLISCSNMFCQNFFTSSMSGGFSIWMVFFPSGL